MNKELYSPYRKKHPQRHKLYYNLYTAMMPAHHYMISFPAKRCLAELEKSQWLSPMEIEKLQIKKMRALLQHAYKNVPYYKKKFDAEGLDIESFKSLKDLRKIPPLSKEEIKNNIDKGLLSTNHNPRHIQETRTGGSTGQPLRFYCDKTQLEYRWASTNRNMRWCGYEIGDKLVRLWGHPLDISKSKNTKMRIDNRLLRRRFLPAFDLTADNMVQYAEELRTFKPRLLEGYAGCLTLFASFLKKAGITDIRPHSVLSSAESLYDHQRKIVEEAFGTKVFDRYGTREFSGIAHECEEHNGYHINSENMIVEVVKGDEPCSEGELGELLITDLNNYSVPFIRYRIGDIARPMDGKCNCGRGLPLLQSVEGRTQAVILCSNGRYVPGTFFPHIFKETEGIDQFQFVQERKNHLILKIVKHENFKEEELQKIMAIVKEEVGQEMEIDIQFVDKIPVGDSGKYYHTISKIPLDLGE